jgi:FkbM family methyltransferase
MTHADTAGLQDASPIPAPPDRREIDRVLTQVRDLVSATKDNRLAIIERDLVRVLSIVTTPAPVPTYIGDGLVFIPTSLGLPLIAFADDLQVTASLLMRRQWDTPTTRLLERILRPGDQFLDVGANIGYFTIFGAALVGFTGRVHAFEPNPRTYALLCRNVQLNSFGHVCSLHAAALADRIDERVLHTFLQNQGSSTLSHLPARLLDEWHERPATQAVPVTTLDAVFADASPKFSCIKIDAEGSEEMIWAGGDRFFRDRVDDRTVILLEWNPPALQGAGADRANLMSRFARHGFSIWRRDDNLHVTRVNAVADLDDWSISELILARDPSRVAALCPTA